jgi:hypothetical protein
LIIDYIEGGNMKLRLTMILLAIGMLVFSGCQVPAGNIPQANTSTYPVELVNVTTGAGTSEAPAASGTAGTSDAAKPKNDDLKIPENAVVKEATEGDLVQLKPVAVDPDKGDVISYFFTKPFNENGKWQTQEGDAGKYLVTITATDGRANSTQDVVVVVHPAKKAPVIECPPEITVKEGEIINLNCNIYDPEGDSVIVEYSGFMKAQTYQTTNDDAGEYTTLVKARNKYKEASKTIKIKIVNVNRAPEIVGVPDVVTGMETEMITIAPKVVDPDNDKVTVSYSEPFDKNGVWQTKLGDAGTYKASVIANDGQSTTKKEFSVEVKMKNTAPVLKKISDITVSEGDTIKLPIDVYDREGDKINVTVSGWMNSPTYTTTYDDAGSYTVTVTASDGQLEAKQTFKVTVLDKNRAPLFKIPA